MSLFAFLCCQTRGGEEVGSPKFDEATDAGPVAEQHLALETKHHLEEHDHANFDDDKKKKFGDHMKDSLGCDKVEIVGTHEGSVVLHAHCIGFSHDAHRKEAAAKIEGGTAVSADEWGKHHCPEPPNHCTKEHTASQAFHDDQRAKAATKLQASFKGKQDRKKVKKTKEEKEAQIAEYKAAAEKPADEIVHEDMDPAAEDAAQAKAATAIQARRRGNQARKKAAAAAAAPAAGEPAAGDAATGDAVDAAAGAAADVAPATDDAAAADVAPATGDAAAADAAGAEALAADDTATILKITVVSATGLRDVVKKYFAKDKSDPFVACEIGKVTHQTKIIYDELSPVWKEEFEVVDYDGESPIKFHIKHPSQKKSAEVTLGKAMVEAAKFLDLTEDKEFVLDLEETGLKKGQVASLTVKIGWAKADGSDAGPEKNWVVRMRAIGLRTGPGVAEDRTNIDLNPGEEFKSNKMVCGTDGQRYLRLADGRGWAFTKSVKDGTDLVESTDPEEQITPPEYEDDEKASLAPSEIAAPEIEAPAPAKIEEVSSRKSKAASLGSNLKARMSRSLTPRPSQKKKASVISQETAQTAQTAPAP